MFRRITLAVLIIGSLGNTWAEPPAPPKSEPHPITLSGPTTAPIRLSPDVWLVASCKVDCVIRGSQVGTGRIKYTSEAGPIRLRGRFAGGTGAVETRTFDGKFVYIVEAESTGPCEVLVVPKELKDEKEIVAIALDVAMDPIPPPVDPEPEVTALAAKIKASGDKDMESMKELAQTYRLIAGRLSANDKAMDKIDTSEKWAQFIKDSREAAIGQKIGNARSAIADYFDASIPIKPDGKFDSTSRKKAAAALSVAAKALDKAVQ